MDHILLEGHNATYDDFSILVAEKYQFNLHLKETLLIKRDKPELNGNIYTHPLELLPNDISYLRLFLWRRSIKKDVLKHFAKFIGKSQCPSFFLEACRFFWKRRLWQRCFPVNYARFLRISFLQNNSGRLLVKSQMTVFLTLFKESILPLWIFTDWLHLDNYKTIFPASA